MTRPQSSRLVIGHWSLAIFLLCAVAVVPLLRSESPCTHDGAFHYYRVAAMRHALQNGTQPLRSAFTRSLRSAFTRYLPDLAFGYGYPFFNYRAALSYYLALALHLTGLALPVAFNLLYALSIAGSALTMYLLARDLFGPRAGVVAAVAYAYAPYQFLDALLRANMPETVALPLLPLILWAFRRLALTGHRRWFLLSASSLAALLLTHNISSLLFAPFLLAYLVVLWLVYRRGEHATAEGAWIAVGSAFALAVGLTAFFLGPALLEQNYAQLHMSRVTRNNDFHYNFLSMAEMFAPPAPVDTSLMNPPMRVHLGLAQAIMGGIGLVAGLVRWRDHERRAMLIFLALATAVMLWMSTRASLWLWEHVPLLPFVQFPWRLVGRAVLPLSLLGGAAASAIPAPTQHADKVRVATRNTHHVSRFTFHVSRITYYVLRIAYYVIVCALILSAFPSTYPPQGYCPNTARPTISDVFAYEHQSGLVGVDPEGSYFPIWVKQRPEGSPLEEQYAAGGPVTRFDETALPAGASVVEADYGPNQARVVVETPARFRARYLAFYFPGWRTWVDGEPTEVTPTDPEGLITFDVPPGRHEVIVRFGSTPTRTAFTTISLLSLAALLVLAIRYPKISNLRSPISNSKPPDSSLVIGHWPLIIVGVLLLVFKLVIVDRIETPFRRPALQPDGALPGVERPLNQPYADGLTLIGYDQERATIPANGALRVDLYWTAHTRPAARYQTVIHLIGPDGMRWSLPDTFRPRGYAKYPPTTSWRPGRYALDSHEIEPLAGTPPGTYDVVATTFDRDTLAPLSVLDEGGRPAAPALTLGEVTLTSPSDPATLDELGIRHRLDTSLGPLTLLGADFDRDEAAPGDSTLLTTFWRADEQPTEDLNAHLALMAPDGSAAAEACPEANAASVVEGYDLPPAVRWYPTSAWRAGDVWRGQHILYLPASIEGGDYTWQLSMQPIYRSTHLPSTLHIAAPDRTFTPPSVAVETDTRLGNVATLLGANLEPETSNLKPGDSLTVTLIWRAEDTSATSYHVFLHLLGPDGMLVVQSDGIPANWTRPTTGWLPGETITDVRVLPVPSDVPAGSYTLSAGLYVPGGERLTAPDGTDAVHLITVTVQAQ